MTSLLSVLKKFDPVEEYSMFRMVENSGYHKMFVDSPNLLWAFSDFAREL